MLFREHSHEEPALLAKGPSDGKSVVDGKSGKSLSEPIPATKSKLSDQGLYLFSLFAYSPKYNNILLFYFHTGLVYKGLIPTRDRDQLMAVFGFGQYSFYNIEALQQKGNVNQPNYTAVLEVDYRIQINKWAFFQPYLQYIIQPNGTGAIENATILGFRNRSRILERLKKLVIARCPAMVSGFRNVACSSEQVQCWLCRDWQVLPLIVAKTIC